MTGPNAPAPTRGLDDVIALQTGVCHLSASDGRLGYRGYDVRELGERSTFEETAFLLLRGELPTGAELREFTSGLRSRQKLSPPILRALKQTPTRADPMAAVRVGLAVLAGEEGDSAPAAETGLLQAMRLLALIPTMVAAIARLRLGERPVLPKKSLGFAANFLAMLPRADTGAEAVRALDAALILRADNELNPSTFAARVTAATGADLFGSILAAWSALSGPRHGSHSRNVAALLDEIGSPEGVEAWVTARMAAGSRIAGFGHQVFRGEDPRTGFLRGLAEAQCASAGLTPLMETAKALEASVVERSGRYPIVDFYLAPLYRALGIPDALFTAIFAVSRMPGWAAHVLEQYQDDRLLRPRAEYIGAVDRPYRPIRSRRT
jgi:2-methylcitrate synthase